MEPFYFEGKIVKAATQADDDGSTKCALVLNIKIRTPEMFANLSTVNRNLGKKLRFTITGDQLDAFDEE